MEGGKYIYVFSNVSAKDGVVKKMIHGYEGNIFPTHIK